MRSFVLAILFSKKLFENRNCDILERKKGYNIANTSNLVGKASSGQSFEIFFRGAIDEENISSNFPCTYPLAPELPSEIRK